MTEVEGSIYTDFTMVHIIYIPWWYHKGHLQAPHPLAATEVYSEHEEHVHQAQKYLMKSYCNNFLARHPLTLLELQDWGYVDSQWKHMPHRDVVRALFGVLSRPPIHINGLFVGRVHVLNSVMWVDWFSTHIFASGFSSISWTVGSSESICCRPTAFTASFIGKSSSSLGSAKKSQNLQLMYSCSWVSKA